jgi:hypothetical protein
MGLQTIKPTQVLTLVLSGILTISIAMMAQTPAKGPIAHYTATTDNVSGAGDAVRIDLLSWSADSDRDQLTAAWTLTAAPASAARGGGNPGGGRGGGGRAGTAPTAGAPPADGASAAAVAGRGGRGRGGGDAGAPPPAAPPQTPEKSLTGAIQKAPTVGFLWRSSESAGYSLHYAYHAPQPDGSERIILATDRRLGAWNNQWKPAGSAKPADYEFSIIELRLNSKGEGEGKASLTGNVTIDREGKTIALDGYTTLPVIFKGVKRTL